MKTVIVQDAHKDTFDRISLVLAKTFTVVGIESRELPDALDKAGDNLAGFIFSDSTPIENSLTLIRKGRDHKHKTWAPIAIVADNTDNQYLPLGCRAFADEQIDELEQYFSNPVPLKVLIIEDDLDIRALIIKILSSDYDVESAPTGDEGLLMFNKGQYDLVVLDFMLPGSLDGAGVLKNIRDNGDETPVVVITAFHEKRRESSLYIEGANDYIIKPFANNQIIADTVRDTLINNHQTCKLKKGDPDSMARDRDWSQYTDRLDSTIA